jgi:hypothetical protein
LDIEVGLVPSKARSIAPNRKPALLPTKLGCIKIRLTYLTFIPTHIRSVMLQIQGVQPPYIEDICVLMPQAKTFMLIEAYMPAFSKLQSCDLVPKSASLQSFKIMDEDEITLAYVC